MKEVERKTDAYFRTLSSKELGEKVRLKVRDGEFALTIEECLLQSFTEQLYHIVELIALLWQMNIEPLVCSGSITIQKKVKRKNLAA